jgi:integrase
MAYIRRLPSGIYQATVRMPNGKRVSETNRLKSVVEKWARRQEAKFAAGDTRDPHAGKIKVADWYDRWAASRVAEAPTKAKNQSLWTTHCRPRWGDWPMQAVQRVDAQAWVGELIDTRRARHQGKPAEAFDDPDEIPTLAPSTIHDIVYLMGSMYRAAMQEHPPLVIVNPFADLDLPRRNARAVEFYERDEAAALYSAVEESHGPAWRLLVELGMDVGLRPGELYGLHGHRVDWIRGLLSVVEVQTREGLRSYPKSMKSNRTVPVPPETLEGMSRLMVGRNRTDRVFTAPDGGLIDDGNFRDRIWYPSILAAGVRRFPPRIMRHTAASWLVQDGVPLYDVQALLGHESFATTTRYAHLAPEAHEKVIASWQRRGAAAATGYGKSGTDGHR